MLLRMIYHNVSQFFTHFECDLFMIYDVCVDMHHLYNDAIFKNLSIICKCVNTTESFVHPYLHLFFHPDPAIQYPCYTFPINYIRF